MEFTKPTFLINPEICKENIRQMVEKAAKSGVIFRPHFKTHQSLIIGRWFRETGITRITVSSFTAAEYFANDGWDDITVAFPVNLKEIDRINQLAAQVRIGVLLEDISVAVLLDRQLKYPVDAYIKIDTGYHRTGLLFEEIPLIKELVTEIRRSTFIRLKGLLTHAGHTYQAATPASVREIYHSSTQILNQVKNNLGIIEPELILSYGDTPSCSVMDSFTDIDEIRPGNFVFYDFMQLLAGVCQHAQISGIIICPVVAVHPYRNQAVLYGGAIHFSKEFVTLSDKRIFGQMVRLTENGWAEPIPGAYLISLSQEHGILEVPDDIIRNLRPGNVVGIIPVHSCLTANLMQGYHLLGGGVADYLTGN